MVENEKELSCKDSLHGNFEVFSCRRLFTVCLGKILDICYFWHKIGFHSNFSLNSFLINSDRVEMVKL